MNPDKLKTLEQKHSEAGRSAKANRRLQNNLGKKKVNNHCWEMQAQLRTKAFPVAHAVVDNASIVGAENLTSVIARKKVMGMSLQRAYGLLGQRRSC